MPANGFPFHLLLHGAHTLPARCELFFKDVFAPQTLQMPDGDDGISHEAVLEAVLEGGIPSQSALFFNKLMTCHNTDTLSPIVSLNRTGTNGTGLQMTPPPVFWPPDRLMDSDSPRNSTIKDDTQEMISSLKGTVVIKDSTQPHPPTVTVVYN